MAIKRIGIIGLGFVGLTTALGFAHKGYFVYGFDINRETNCRISNRKSPFFEEGLESLLEQFLGKIFFLSDDLNSLIRESEVIFICVGTPTLENGVQDISSVKSVFFEILQNMRDYKIIVIKSTVLPGTIDNLIKEVKKYGYQYGIDYSLISNPEFLREGCALLDVLNPDRLVLGIRKGDNKAIEYMIELYKSFVDPEKIILLSPKASEFVKYANNTILSTLISFANELSIIANKVGIQDEIPGIFKALQLDKRWSGRPAQMISYFFPGCGYGGYCLPKDTKALYAFSRDMGFIPPILKGNLEINEAICDLWVELLKKKIPKEEKIGVLGLSFKPNTDDVRDTPARRIIEKLIKSGYLIIAYDPVAIENFKKHYSFLRINYCSSLDELLKKVNYIIIITPWKEFAKVFQFKNKHIFNLRYLLFD